LTEARHTSTRLELALCLLCLCCSTSCNNGSRSGDDAGPPDGGEPDADPETTTASLLLGETIDDVPGWSLAWAVRVGAPGEDYVVGSGSTADSLWVTGVFMSEVVFGEGEENETTLYGDVVGHVFLARYGPDGGLAWAVSSSGDAESHGEKVDPREDGSAIVVGGYGSSPFVLGEGEPDETVLTTTSGCTSAFAASYEHDGALAWAEAIEATLPDSEDQCSAWAVGLAAADDGSALVSGQFEGRVVLAGGAPEEIALDSAGCRDGFLARYDQDGSLLWARRVGGEGDDEFGAVEALPDGDLFVLGYFSGAVVFGQGGPKEIELVAQGGQSVFLARYDADGELVWARDLGIDGPEDSVDHAVGGLAVLQDGDVAATGRFQGAMLEGPGEGDELVETPEGGQGVFLFRCSPDGERVWNSVDTCTESYNTAWDVGQIPGGSLVVAGTYDGTCTFGQGEAQETVLDSQGGGVMDAYAAMYDQEGSLEWALAQAGPGWDRFTGVETFAAGPTDPDAFVVSGRFEDTVTFGTGGGDEIELTASGSEMDIVILRFDRDVPGE
jgi:hypothetical protein